MISPYRAGIQLDCERGKIQDAMRAMSISLKEKIQEKNYKIRNALTNTQCFTRAEDGFGGDMIELAQIGYRDFVLTCNDG